MLQPDGVGPAPAGATATIRAFAGRVRLALAVELPWLTLLPYAEDAAVGRGWVPFRLPAGCDVRRFAEAIQAEGVPVEAWAEGDGDEGAALALPISPNYGEEDLLHLPLAVAKAAHYLLRAGVPGPACPARAGSGR